MPPSTTATACRRLASTRRASKPTLKDMPEPNMAISAGHAAGEVCDLAFKPGRQVRYSARCQQLAEIGALHRNPADRTIGQHVDRSPTRRTAAHHVVQLEWR